MKKLVIAFAALSLAACASGANPGAMVPEVNEAVLIEASSPLYEGVSVGDVSGGRETNPLWTSQVSSEDFAEALRQSFAAHAMLATETGTYRLDAVMVELKQPWGGFNMTVDSSVQYTLTNVETGEVVYENQVDAEYTASVGDAFVGYERLRLANEGSVKTNIAQMLADIVEAVAN